MHLLAQEAARLLATEVSAVTPFRYSRLLLGVGLGVVWFGESIDMQMVLGCGLIVLSGLFVLWRSKSR